MHYRRNADTQLRTAWRRYQMEQTKSSWMQYLQEALRSGLFPFSPDAIHGATSGIIEDFVVTPDGFMAKLQGAEFPAIEARIQFDEDDWDSFPRGPYDATMRVTWDERMGDEAPTLYLEIEDIEEEFGVEGYTLSSTFRTLRGGEYCYVGEPVENNEALRAAAQNPKEWEEI